MNYPDPNPPCGERRILHGLSGSSPCASLKMVWVRGGSGASGSAAGGPGWFASPTLTPRYPPCLCLSCPGGLAMGRSWSVGANKVGGLTSLGGGPSALCACSRVSRASPCAWLRSGHTSRGIALLLRCGLALRSPLGIIFNLQKWHPIFGDRKAQAKAHVSKAQGKAQVLKGSSQGGGLLCCSV